MKKIQEEIAEITSKLETCTKEIASRQDEIAKLKDKNAELVEMHLGKARRPPSLLVQRKRIADLADQVKEFQFLQRNLEQSLKYSQEKLQESLHQSKVDEYLKAEAAHLDCYQRVQTLFSELMAAIEQLEKIQAGHCLERLCQLVSALDTEKLASCGVDVNQVLAKFAKIDLPSDLDGARMHSLKVNLTNLANQLKAIASGKRVYSKIKLAPTPATAPKVSRIQAARQLEEYRIKDMDALKRAKEHKQVIHHQPHK